MYHKSHFTLFLYNIYCILQFFKVCLDKFGDSDKKKQDRSLRSTGFPVKYVWLHTNVHLLIRVCYYIQWTDVVMGTTCFTLWYKINSKSSGFSVIKHIYFKVVFCDVLWSFFCLKHNALGYSEHLLQKCKVSGSHCLWLVLQYFFFREAILSIDAPYLIVELSFGCCPLTILETFKRMEHLVKNTKRMWYWQTTVYLGVVFK